MNDKTLELLEKLALKFNTTADHLWSVLVKQAPISSLCDIAIFSFWITIQYKAYKFLKSKDDDEYILGSILWLISGLCLLVALALSFTTTISGLFNPEYWALKQLIK